jgi:hypothetical protein
MANLRNLGPVQSGRKSSTLGVTVAGNLIRMSPEVVTRIGASNDVNFSIGGPNNDRLYIRSGVSDAAPFKLLGRDGGRRYVNDAGVVKAARLGSGNYPILFDEELKANYIQFDPNAPEPTAPAPRKRPAKDEKAEAKTGTAAAKTAGATSEKPKRPA